MREFDLSAALRTDLAEETVERFHEKNGKKNEIPGLVSRKTVKNGFDIHFLQVSDKNGEAASGKRIGSYLTLNIGKIWISERERFPHGRLYARRLHSFLYSERTAGGRAMYAGRARKTAPLSLTR